jgi:hypothetical protein
MLKICTGNDSWNLENIDVVELLPGAKTISF